MAQRKYLTGKVFSSLDTTPRVHPRKIIGIRVRSTKGKYYLMEDVIIEFSGTTCGDVFKRRLDKFMEERSVSYY